MKFSIIHPTARVTGEFAHPWWLAHDSALTTCANPRDVEYIVVVHESRARDFRLHDGLLWAAFGRFTVVVNYGRDCLVDQCNAGQLAMSGEILVGNQDDMRYPEHWDTEILKLIPDTSKLVCVRAKSDGAPRPDLLTLPTIATRALVEAIGPISPEYDGMFSDNEWSEKAQVFGSVIPSSLYFRHLHPVHGLSKSDAVYAMENREEAYRIGQEVYRRRKAAGFPRVELPGFPPAPRKERIIAICTPGEQHSNRWNRERDRLIFALIEAGWTPRTYWDYTTNVYHTRMGITRDIVKDAEITGQAPALVLWIDDDNIPDARSVEFLLSTLEAHSEYAGAVGWCWIRFYDNEGNVAWMPSCGNFKPGSVSCLLSTKLADLYADNAAPKQIEWSGFPMVLMRYEALAQLGMQAFQPIFTDENEFGFTGEDTAFFACARIAGLRFCVDPRAKVEHLKLLPQEPDYEIPKQCAPEIASAIEADRMRRKGDRVERHELTVAGM